jgi:DNA-binding transcriptional regulator YhcF (GntR family)
VAAVAGSSGSSPREIAEALRQRIRAGDLKAGERLPTQAELAAGFGVERGAVRQALRILHADGMLAGTGRGSPPRVAEPPRTDHEPQPATVALAPRLAEAFAAPHVRMDAVSLTAQTLMLALTEPVRLIHEGRIRPESIDLRVLVPSRNISLAFPVPVDGEDDDETLHDRWLARRNAQCLVIRHNLHSLRHSHGIRVNVSFRALPFTPPVKLYLLNGTEVLMAYYLVTRREEEGEEGEGLEMYDVLGSQALLFSFERGVGRRDAAFVEQSERWFEALWNTVTTELTLG